VGGVGVLRLPSQARAAIKATTTKPMSTKIQIGGFDFGGACGG